MDWSNEDYVRVYTRETADDLDLSWEALALWRALLVKFDRSGLIAARNGWLSVSRMTRIPLEVVERSGPELIRDGRIKPVNGGYLAPNYIAAQTTSKSDKARQKESRDRRRDIAASQVIDPSSPNCSYDNSLSRAVTSSHVAVTAGHDESRNVTLSVATLSDTAALRGSALLPVTPAAPGKIQGPTQGGLGVLAQKVDDSVRERDRKRTTPKHALPEDWEPARSDANLEAESIAISRGVDLGEQLKNLRDWAAANNARKADWNATWRNWTRNAKPSRPQHQTGMDAVLRIANGGDS